MTIAEFRCKHGYGPNDPRYNGMVMAAPYTTCKCCGRIQFYVDSGSWGWIMDSSGKGHGEAKGRFWTKDLCDGCGGKYNEW